MKGLIKALEEKKMARRAGSVSEADRKELADFYERELAKFATSKHGGAKAFAKDDEDDGEDVDDTDLAGGSDSENEDEDEKETAEDRDFIADSETDAGSDSEQDDDNEPDFVDSSDSDENDD